MRVSEPLRIAFVPGVTPDKWARIWRERRPDTPLELVPVGESSQREVLETGQADMVLARLPLDQEGLHLIRLYDEQPVVVVSREHPAAAFDELDLADLVDEQLVVGEVPGWAQLRTQAPLDFPEMTVPQAFEVIASGTGMGIVPMSVARLHHRKDLTSRPVTGLPPTTVGLAWPTQLDDDRSEDFIGIVRGRTARSSRGRGPSSAPASESATSTSKRGRSAKASGSGRSGSRAGTRGGRGKGASGSRSRGGRRR